MPNQSSTPVPLRIAKRIFTGILILSSVTASSAAVRYGLELSNQQGVSVALTRLSNVAVPRKAQALEVKKPAAPQPKKAAYFIKPAKGLDWGIIHANNGVDIANDCGTPIVAAAAGTVVQIGAGWNGGYGNAITIKHGNGTKTYYAHLTTIGVIDGQEVAQGEQIGTMGITGKSTGCHLHFEVHGGTNPFGK